MHENVRIEREEHIKQYGDSYTHPLWVGHGRCASHPTSLLLAIQNATDNPPVYDKTIKGAIKNNRN